MDARTEDFMSLAALRQVIATLPPEAMRALAAITENASACGLSDILLGRLQREPEFYAGSANQMSNEDAISLQAFRYFVGRSTTGVHSHIGWLEERWTDMAANVRETITGELRGALDRGAAGEQVDSNAWSGFLERVEPAATMPGMR